MVTLLPKLPSIHSTVHFYMQLPAWSLSCTHCLTNFEWWYTEYAILAMQLIQQRHYAKNFFDIQAHYILQHNEQNYPVQQ